MVLSSLLLVAAVVKIQQLLVELDGRGVLQQLGDGVELVLGLLVHPIAAAVAVASPSPTAAVGFPVLSHLFLHLFDWSDHAPSKFS